MTISEIKAVIFLSEGYAALILSSCSGFHLVWSGTEINFILQLITLSICSNKWIPVSRDPKIEGEDGRAVRHLQGHVGTGSLFK